MKTCPDCGARLRRELERVYEIDDTTYFDLRFTCERCGHSSFKTVSRKSPVPKAGDMSTELTASLKLREYMPERKAAVEREAPSRGSAATLLSARRREALIYLAAVALGVAVEVAGLQFEVYLKALRIDPLAGFVTSLLIFVFAPLVIAGAAVYYATGDRLKALLLGSLAVPLTIILVAKLGLGA